MRIVLTSIFVHDQEVALSFYTEILGFVKKTEFPWASIGGSRSSLPSNPTAPSFL